MVLELSTAKPITVYQIKSQLDRLLWYIKFGSTVFSYLAAKMQNILCLMRKFNF